jgi:hypothetical protein
MPRLLQARPDAGEDLADHLAAVAARRLDGLGQHAVAQRIDVAEGQLLQLAIEVVQPQPVGDRGVDLQRLARDAAALVRPQGVQRAHVVQAVGQLDEDDAHVARHRQQHLAEVLRLGVLDRLELDLVQLGDAVDQLGRHLAEALGDLGLGDVGVLGDVVQQRRHQRLGVEVPAGEDAGHRQRVREVGVAADAELALVRLGREDGRRRRRARCPRPEVGAEQLPQLLELEGELSVDRLRGL